ncbi:ABC transporter ATP-binding protein [Chloroflexota bacterium]
MSQNIVIETKTYGDFTAVDKLNLAISEGEIFGFLGPNGAGKTTTILMLLGLTEPTSGNATVYGYNPLREPLKVKSKVGYMPEKIGFYEDLTTKQNLDYTAKLNGVAWAAIPQRIEEVLDAVGLIDTLDKKVGQFSHGMKQRLGIADVMIKDPKIIFFDEPTSGIDPKGIEEVLALIAIMAKKNITAIISSHQLHQIQRICTRVGIISKGKLVVEGSIDILGRDAMAGGKIQIEVEAEPITDKLIKAIEKIKGVTKVDSLEDSLIVTCDKDLRHEISKTVVNSDSLLTEMKIEQYDLEDIYMKYFQEPK